MCKLPGPKECLPILFLATKSSLVWKMDNKLKFWVALWIILHSVYHINHWPDLTSAHCTAIAIPTILDLTIRSWSRLCSTLHYVQHCALCAAPCTVCSTLHLLKHLAICAAPCIMCSTLYYVQHLALCGATYTMCITLHFVQQKVNDCKPADIAETFVWKYM